MKDYRYIFIMFLFAPAFISLSSCQWIKATFYIDHMERDERLAVIQADKVVETLRVRPGEKIADIGAGSGLMTRRLAVKSGSGTVYAVDINLKLLKHIAENACKKGQTNIRTVLANEADPKIPEPVDTILICDTIHYIKGPDVNVKKLHDYLKPQGRAAIINFSRNWPPMSNKFRESDLMKWMKNAGFEFLKKHSFLKDRYFVVFQKK